MKSIHGSSIFYTKFRRNESDIYNNSEKKLSIKFIKKILVVWNKVQIQVKNVD